MGNCHIGSVVALILLALPAGAVTKRVDKLDGVDAVVRVDGAVDQTAINSAVTNCGSGCTFYFTPDTVATGSWVIDGDQSGGVRFSGPRHGTATLQQEVLDSVTGPVADCGSGFECQDEHYTPIICATSNADTTPSTRNADCGGTTGDAPDGIVISNLKIDGRKDEQPTPRPEQCYDAEDNGTDTCNHNKQVLVELEAGDSHVIDGVEFLDSTHTGLRIENCDGCTITASTFGGMGCDVADSACGSNWTAVNGKYESRLGLTTSSQSTGFGLRIGDLTDNASITSNVVNYATNAGLELKGLSGACGTTGKGEDAAVTANSFASSIQVTDYCRATITANTIVAPAVSGEASVEETANGIYVVGASPFLVAQLNIITTTQTHGMFLDLDADGDTILLKDNSITNSCDSSTVVCTGLKIEGVSGTSGINAYRNIIDVGAGEDIGIHLLGAAGSQNLALNRIKGGAVSTLQHALQLENTVSADVRYNVLDWDTGISSSAIEVNGTIGATIQADAFAETLNTGTGYAGAGGGVRYVEANTPTYLDCSTNLANAACYSTAAVVYAPDTQLSLGKGTAASIDDGYFDEVVQLVLDSRDAFQMQEAVGLADEADERWNIKFVAGVGDITNTYNQGSPAGQAHVNMADIYARLNDSSLSVPIPYAPAVGNHDCSGGVTPWDCSFFQAAFGPDDLGATRADVRKSTDAIAQPVYADADDLASAHRYKPLTNWAQVISLPFSTGNLGDWRTWTQSRLNEYPNDYALFLQHEMSSTSGETDGGCGRTLPVDLRDMMLEESADGEHTNGGLGYRAWYAAASGHFIESTGWFCHELETNLNGDSFLWTGANWQQTDTFGAGGGDGWLVVLDHDYNANTIDGSAYSPLANSGAGGSATDFDSSEPSAGVYDWTESLDLTTR